MENNKKKKNEKKIKKKGIQYMLMDRKRKERGRERFIEKNAQIF